jgi:hypothetical protein
MSLSARIIARFLGEFPKASQPAIDRLRAIIDEESRGEPTAKAAPIPRKRNDLLDALVSLCGGVPESTTKSEFRSAATALAEIKTVCPDLTVAELTARVDCYKRKNKDWALTPPALAKWWSHLGGGPRTQSERADIYMEPPGWRGILQSMYGLSPDGIRDKQWLDLGPDTRRDVLKRMHAV